jgi:hypothetical protein
MEDHPMKHEWEEIKDGRLTVKPRFICHRCGTVVQGESSDYPASIARKFSVLEDCDEQTVAQVLNT